MRRRLHQIEHRRDDGRRTPRSSDPDTEPQSDDGCEWYRNQHDRQGPHGIPPQSEDREVKETTGGKQCQTPPADPMTENADTDHHRHPGDRRNTGLTHAPIKQKLRPLQRIGQHVRDPARDIPEFQGADRRVVAEPVRKLGHPKFERHNPRLGPAHGPFPNRCKPKTDRNDHKGLNGRISQRKPPRGRDV